MNMTPCPEFLQITNGRALAENRPDGTLQAAGSRSRNGGCAQNRVASFWRGGRAVDGSGLEIRVEDFGRNWTACPSSVLAFHETTA